MKRLMSFLLVFAIIFTLLPADVLAEEPNGEELTTEDTESYTVEEDGSLEAVLPEPEEETYEIVDAIEGEAELSEPTTDEVEEATAAAPEEAEPEESAEEAEPEETDAENNELPEKVELTSDLMMSRKSELCDFWDMMNLQGRIVLLQDGTLEVSEPSYADGSIIGLFLSMIDLYNDLIRTGIFTAVQTEQGIEMILNVSVNLIEPSLGSTMNSMSLYQSSHGCEFVPIDWMAMCHENYIELQNVYLNCLDSQNPISFELAYSTAALYYYEKVNHKGDWDYKALEYYQDLSLDKDMFCSYYDGAYQHISLEKMGNYNFGYTGSFLFPLNVLHAGSWYAAGFEKADISDWGDVDEGFYAAQQHEGNRPLTPSSMEWKDFSSIMYVNEEKIWTVSTEPADTEVSWFSSDTSVATVDFGHVTAKKAGTVTISAVAGGIRLEKVLTVKSPSLEWGTTETEIDKNTMTRWTVTALPDAPVTWKVSNTKIATVTNGSISGVGEGTATITASANGLSLSKKITVKKPRLTSSVTSIKLYFHEEYQWVVDPSSTGCGNIKYSSSNTDIVKVGENGLLIAGKKKGDATITATPATGDPLSLKVSVVKPTIKFTATATPMYAGYCYQWKAETVPNNTIEWESSDPKIATVSDSGLVTAVSPGKTKIYISSRANAAVSEKKDVTVKNPTISWKSCTTSIYKGASCTWTVTTNPANADVTWSSDNADVATVKDGVIQGVGIGTANISATLKGGATVSKKITVKKPTVAWKSCTTSIYKGASCTWTVTTNPANADVTWASDNINVATVKDGIIQGVGVGSATITAAVKDGASVSKKITVKSPTVAWKSSTTSIYKGASCTWTVTTNPANADVAWTSNNTNIATVRNGVIQGVGVGSATITAAVKDGASVSKKITVKSPTVAWNSAPTTLCKGYNYTWTVTTNPANSAVTWTSDNPGVATVNNGTISCKNTGTATITARLQGDSAIYVSKQVKVVLPTITWNSASTTVYKGGSCTWSVKTTPSNAAVVWESSNTNVATVSGGKIYAKGVGTATITASLNADSKIYVSKTITVLPPTISWSSAPDSIYKGESCTWSVKTNPSGASVKWTSSNSNIASVNSSGKIQGNKAGTAKITAAIANENISISKTITIKAPTLSWSAYNSSTIYAGYQYQWKVSAMPNNTVTWSSSNTSVATVSSNGLVTAKGIGTVTIKASANGLTISHTVTVSKPSISWSDGGGTKTISLNKSATLSVTTLPAGVNVTWRSSNPSVVSVTSAGTITGKTRGNAYVYAELTGKSISISRLVKVK